MPEATRYQAFAEYVAGLQSFEEDYPARVDSAAQSVLRLGIPPEHNQLVGKPFAAHIESLRHYFNAQEAATANAIEACRLVCTATGVEVKADED